MSHLVHMVAEDIQYLKTRSLSLTRHHQRNTLLYLMQTNWHGFEAGISERTGNHPQSLTGVHESIPFITNYSHLCGSSIRGTPKPPNAQPKVSLALQVAKEVFAKYLELLKQAFKQFALRETSAAVASPSLLDPSIEEGGKICLHNLTWCLIYCICCRSIVIATMLLCYSKIETC